MPAASRILIIIGCVSLSCALLLSAVGFHALAAMLTPAKQASWAWAVELQAYNSLGLILLGLLRPRLGLPRLTGLAGILLVAGLFLFSGSIYLECLGAPETIGSVAPYGGTSFIVAWLLVAVAVWRSGRAADVA